MGLGIVLLVVMGLTSSACAKQNDEPQPVASQPKVEIPQSHPQLLGFYDQNAHYSRVFLRNVLQEKSDILQRQKFQAEKRLASRELITKKNNLAQKQTKVDELEKKLSDLKQRDSIGSHEGEPSPLRSRNQGEIDQLEKDLQQAKIERNQAQDQYQIAQKNYQEKSQAFANFSAQIKEKVDELNDLELYSDIGLEDLYNSL